MMPYIPVLLVLFCECAKKNPHEELHADGMYTSGAVLQHASRMRYATAYRPCEFPSVYRRGAWATQVKAREKALEKLVASDDYVKQPPNLGKPFRFRFPPAPRTGTSEELVSANAISHGYNGNTLFDNVNLVVDKGDRIAFLGANGAGKSTLLRLVVGQEEPDQGRCMLGSGVVKQYFEQNQADALDLSKTVIETMMGASTTEKYEDLRKLLGQFLFKGDSVEKSVAQLSGGEKARVALCKMMLTPANLLVLDEPTNHLDIPAKEMLEEALQHYEGAVLVVSHDRYFVSQVSRQCSYFNNRGGTDERGPTPGLHEYLHLLPNYLFDGAYASNLLARRISRTPHEFCISCRFAT